MHPLAGLSQNNRIEHIDVLKKNSPEEMLWPLGDIAIHVYSF
jgi:hypothetical protein